MMAKPITESMKKRFAKFVAKRSHDNELRGAFDTDDALRAIGSNNDSGEAWAFQPEDDKTRCFYELFQSLDEPFSVEEHGYDDFYAVDSTFEFEPEDE